METQTSRWRLPILLIVVFVVSAVPVVYLEFGQAGLEAVSIVGTTLLTAVLAILYNKQHFALRIQQEPQIEVSDIDLSDDLQHLRLHISNFGGGAATSMLLKIELFELSGDGPVNEAEGKLRRIQSDEDGNEISTRSSSIRPSEIDVAFDAISRTVLALGGSGPQQESLGRLVHSLLNEDRNVVYGKVLIEFETQHDDYNCYTADFSLKFTMTDEIQSEAMDFLPWEESEVRSELGG